MRVLSTVLLASTIFSAYAVPKIQPLILDTTSGSNESSMTNGENSCTDIYNKQQTYVNQQIAAQTSACLSTQPLTPPSPQTLDQIAIVKANLTSLEKNLSICLALTDNLEFVTCVANNNDENQHLLNNANENAQNAEGQLNNAQITPGAQKNCVSHVLSHAKTNFTNAVNAYNKCLEDVLNQ